MTHGPRRGCATIIYDIFFHYAFRSFSAFLPPRFSPSLSGLRAAATGPTHEPRLNGVASADGTFFHGTEKHRQPLCEFHERERLVTEERPRRFDEERRERGGGREGKKKEGRERERGRRRRRRWRRKWVKSSGYNG